MEYAKNKFLQLAEKHERWREKWAEEDRKAEKNTQASGTKPADSPVPVDGRAENDPVGTISEVNEKKENGSGNRKEISPDEMSLLEFRKKLVEMARERGEATDLMQIIGDPPEKLHERWRRYQDENRLRKKSGENSGPQNQKGKNPKKKKRK